jgi:hypothetical protein
MFSIEKIGADAFHVLSDIDPSMASFKVPTELFSLQTQYVNLHDTFISHLDSSGKSLTEHTLERRLDCFEIFCGQHGRS